MCLEWFWFLGAFKLADKPFKNAFCGKQGDFKGDFRSDSPW